MGNFDNGTMEINETRLANVAKELYRLYRIRSFGECMQILHNLESQEDERLFPMRESTRKKLMVIRKYIPDILQYNTESIIGMPLDKIKEIYDNACRQEEAMKEEKAER